MSAAIKTTVKVAVIGVGYLGRFHAQKYAAMENVELVGVADSNPERAAEIARECDCRSFVDYRELLPLVDAVSVVTTTSLHHAVAGDCLRAGVDVMLEKPMTTTLEEADELLALAAAGECILQIGHLERFNPAVQALWPMIDRPLFVEAQRLSTFKERGADVDVVLDLMIHDLDLILALVRSPIVSLLAVGAPVLTKLTDITNVRLIFANGCTANITASRISLKNIRKMRIFQPRQYLALDFSTREITDARLSPEIGKPIAAPTVQTTAYPQGDALEMELRAFVGHVRERSRPLVDGLEGRKALDVALQVIAQINGDRPRFEQILRETDAQADET